MRRSTLAFLAACQAVLAATAASAAALSVSPANEGIPPGLAGVWVEEREDVDGGPAMVLSRQWLPDGNGFVMYSQVAENGTLAKGAFIRDRFLGWECAGAGGVIHFYTDSIDYDDRGTLVRERMLCLAGVLEGDQLSYNYTLAEDGCPASADRWTARRVPTALLGARAGEGEGACP